MSLLGTVIKIGAVAAATVIGQRMWDRYHVEEIYVELDAIVNRARADVRRVGTVRANARVLSRDLLAQYEQRLVFTDSLKELRNNYEIYIESIPD